MVNNFSSTLLSYVPDEVAQFLSPASLLKGFFLYETVTTIFLCSIVIWILNRQTHIKVTRGSVVTHKDESEGNNVNENDTKDEIIKRHRCSQLIKNDTPELDDEEFETDYEMEDDEQHAASPERKMSPRFSNMKQYSSELSPDRAALRDVMKKMKIFSYLNPKAQKLVVKNVSHLNLSRDDYLFEQGSYDGSMYVVMSGGISITFHDYPVPEDEQIGDESHLLTHRCGPGDIVTPLLAMIAGLISYEEQEASTNAATTTGASSSSPPGGDCAKVPFSEGISVVATSDGTELLRVPPLCFSAILRKYPMDVHRMAQIALCRIQRLTVLTLVGTLGLRKELLIEKGRHRHDKGDDVKPKKFREEWDALTQLLDKSNTDVTVKETEILREAEVLAGLQLGLSSSESGILLKNKCRLITKPANSTVISTGEPSDDMLLLLGGTIERGIITPKGAHNNNPSWSFYCHQTISSPGAILNLTSCFSGEVNLFTTRCVSKCTLLSIPKATFESILVAHPSVMTFALRAITRMIPPIVYLLAWNAEWKRFESSDLVLRRGSTPSNLFWVFNGRLRADYSSRGGGGDDKAGRNGGGGSGGMKSFSREYGRGKCVGDVASLTRTPSPCDVYAIRHSDVVVVPVLCLIVICGIFPGAGLNLARSIAAGVKSHGEEEQDGMGVKSGDVGGTDVPQLMRSYGLTLATLAVVPLTDSISLQDFCKNLTLSLQNMAPTKLVTKREILQELSPTRDNQRYYRDDPHFELKVTQVLADAEENNRLVVYQADWKYTWWSKLCVQQADAILLVVDANGAPKKHRVEQLLAWAYESMHTRIELVVVKQEHQFDSFHDVIADYEKDTSVMTVSDQLNDWSEAREWVTGHHLVRSPFNKYKLDFRRLCRRFTGRSIGLVLGGGGARGLAHLGVIRALVEAGVAVDMVGGTSQGAFCGALYSKYPDNFNKLMEESRKMATNMAARKEKIFDLTLPILSIFNGKRFNQGIRTSLGTSRIQDLILRFFCVSVDLQTKTMIVHTKGLLWKYVRASMSLTGYLPPLSEDGRLLVDGGYMNVCPADVMKKQFEARTIIAVDVASESTRNYNDYGPHLSGLWLLWNSWNPFIKTVQVPSWGDIQNMTIWVCSEEHRQNNVMPHSNLLLKPPIQKIGTLDYHRFDEVVEIGYQYAKPIVDEWVKKNPWAVSEKGSQL